MSEPMPTTATCPRCGTERQPTNIPVRHWICYSCFTAVNAELSALRASLPLWRERPMCDGLWLVGTDPHGYCAFHLVNVKMPANGLEHFAIAFGPLPERTENPTSAG